MHFQSKPILGGCCSQISSTWVTSDVRVVCCTLSRQVKQDVSNARGSGGPEVFAAGRLNTQSIFMKRVDVSGSMTWRSQKIIILWRRQGNLKPQRLGSELVARTT